MEHPRDLGKSGSIPTEGFAGVGCAKKRPGPESPGRPLPGAGDRKETPGGGGMEGEKEMGGASYCPVDATSSPYGRLLRPSALCQQEDPFPTFSLLYINFDHRARGSFSVWPNFFRPSTPSGRSEPAAPASLPLTGSPWKKTGGPATGLSWAKPEPWFRTCLHAACAGPRRAALRGRAPWPPSRAVPRDSGPPGGSPDPDRRHPCIAVGSCHGRCLGGA